MRTVSYNAFASNTTTAAGLGTCTVVRAGTIYGVSFTTAAQGAGVGGGLIKISAMVNDAVDTLAAVTANTARLPYIGSMTMETTTGSWTARSFYIPCSVPVVPGDRLSMTMNAVAGTAAAACYAGVVFHVKES